MSHTFGGITHMVVQLRLCYRWEEPDQHWPRQHDPSLSGTGRLDRLDSAEQEDSGKQYRFHVSALLIVG